MHVIVISPEAAVYEGDADAVLAPAYDGLVGILPQHAPFMTLLGSGPLTITYGAAVSNAQWIVSQWTGVDQTGTNGSGAIGQTNSSRGDAVSALSVALAAFGNASNVAYGIAGASTNGPAVTPGAGFAEITETSSGESTLLETEWATNLNNIQASLSKAANAGLLGVELKAKAGPS